MATVTINNSPIHSTSIITYPFGIADSGYSCGWHTGIDFAPYGGTERNPYLYSVCSGEVVEVNLTPSLALGNNVVIKEDVTGNFWRFCHMVTGSIQVIQGQRVTTSTIIGRMGATRKCNRNPLTFRVRYDSKMAMFNIFKSCKCFRYSQCR